MLLEIGILVAVGMVGVGFWTWTLGRKDRRKRQAPRLRVGPQPKKKR